MSDEVRTRCLIDTENHLHQLFILPLNYGFEPHDVPLFRLCQGQIASSTASRESLL